MGFSFSTKIDSVRTLYYKKSMWKSTEEETEMAKRRRKHLSQKRLKNEERTFLSRERNSTQSPLYSMVGKQVKINRGGPNSKEGILLKAKKDYVALLADQEVFYFMTKHIHSVTQNIKVNSSIVDTNTDTEISCLSSETFTDLLNELKHQSVQINHGPESRIGELLNVNPSMLVILHEEDGPIYYNLEHVKFIKASSNDEDQEKIQSRRVDQSNYLYFDDIGRDTYSDLIGKFKYQWVSVNRTGPEALEGVLLDEGSGFYTIVNNEEAFRIHPFHIKSISLGAKGSFKTSNENDGEESQEQRVEDSSSYERESHHSSKSTYLESCSCEESYNNDDDSVEDNIWRPRHHVKTIDVFN